MKNFNAFKDSYLKQYKSKKEELKKLYETKIKNNNLQKNYFIEKLKNEENEIEIELSDNNVIKVKLSLLRKYPYSKLATYFNGKIEPPQRNNHIFVDRGSKGFILLTEYLKRSEPPKFNDEIEKKLFFDELNYWSINIKIAENDLLKFDLNWCPNFFVLEKNQRTLSKTNVSHGIVLLKRKLSLVNPFIEFSVLLNNPYCSNRKILLALIEQSKFKRKHLSSSFEKDVPYIFFWDTYYNKIVKQCGENYKTMELNKSCQCYLNFYENKFGLKYDHQAQSVELFRNDINLGVLIKNIPPFLTPALEISMEDCKIQLSSNNFPQERFFL